ncbi:CRISPR-associated protein Cas5 [Thermoflexus hugenholtzii]|uniref:CRISPR-associated protein, Cas5 family n=1 Tax=Thermoflexus hugenholtzii JAD2 TaxID=877466 RepID=A0A212RMU8_9CHLR|nr:CRISPR-associated protein Cas5 [Thermoflexus hugenholtzii]SNB73786.1 CRISPR-associated protein, Cas5 family [Thermoflexus hugenholtzii JAD2]
MERILVVMVRAPVVSFRRPMDHNYQRTLPMPPPTTLLGIAGAALGLSDRELWAQDSPMRDLRVSVWIEGETGRAYDMWTVLKIKGGRIAERSPYFRELLFFADYTLLYGGREELLRRLERAFQDPVYALSLGREDELMLIEDIRWGEAAPGEPRFRGTVLPVDLRQTPGARPILTPGASFEPPVVETLPLRFRVDTKGIRHPESSIPLTFLPLSLELEVPGMPALQWEGRNFTWLNSSPSPTSRSSST